MRLKLHGKLRPNRKKIELPTINLADLCLNVFETVVRCHRPANVCLEFLYRVREHLSLVFAQMPNETFVYVVTKARVSSC